MAGIMVVFDFDRTLIDDDSDRWVISELGTTDLFRCLRRTIPSWTSLMDRMMEELHEQGRTIEDIAECLRRIPLDPHVAAAIKSAHSLGCDLRVVSDANMFFIETILKHHGLISCFSEINTNPSYINGEGKLRILPYHNPTTPHGCSLCPSNMCKGKIIERIRASTADSSETWNEKRFIYLGDGPGDYCPTLKLNERDCVMPRRNHPLLSLIKQNPSLVKAQFHEWSDGREMERILLQLISYSSGATVPPLPVECKFEATPVSLP